MASLVSASLQDGPTETPILLKPNECTTVETEEEISSSGSSATDYSTSATSNTPDTIDPKVADAHTTYYPHPTDFKLSEHPVDEGRQLNVRSIGLLWFGKVN